MRAILRVPFPPETNLDMEKMHHLDKGVLKGGYSCIGQVPQGDTCLVAIEAPAAYVVELGTTKGYELLDDGAVEATAAAKAELKITEAEFQRGKVYIRESDGSGPDLELGGKEW